MPYHIVPRAANAMDSYEIHQKLLSRVEMGRVNVVAGHITVIGRVMV